MSLVDVHVVVVRIMLAYLGCSSDARIMQQKSLFLQKKSSNKLQLICSRLFVLLQKTENYQSR